jgi:hypothetical protein
MGHHTEVQIREEKYIFTDKAKRLTFILMAVGLLLTILGYFTYHPSIEGLNEEQLHHLPMKRLLGSIFFNGYFAFIISAIALAFLAMNRLSNAGWYTGVSRIFEGLTAYMGIGAIILFVVLLSGISTIYHWAHEGVMDSDPILMKKTWYLNKPFFLGRFAIFTGFWTLCAFLYRKWSRQEDQLSSGLTDTTYFDKIFRLMAAFMLIFAFTFSMFAWDMTMSIDAHWYSTIFTLYNFGSGWVSALTIVYLFVHYLRSKGYLNVVTDEHIHDLGKWMFAVSMFWAYMWVAQFLLIWYANIPEEVAYYAPRLFGSYKMAFYFNLIMNFIIPFFLFMKRGAKRNPTMGIIVGSCILIGHWNDMYYMVMPGAMNLATSISEHNPTGIIEVPSQGWGMMEIGGLAFFAGLFLFVVQNALTKSNLYPTKHPYIIESALHDTGV